MSIKQRLNNVERKVGRNKEPLIVLIRKFIEGAEIGTAVVMNGAGASTVISRNSGESAKAFEERLAHLARGHAA